MLRELAEAVRSRRVAARELVALALDRIDRLDGDLNAVVALRAEEALAEAGRLDDRIASGETGPPLIGIPCLIKDIEDLADLPTTHGSLLFRDAPPARADGPSATRLRAAGAIPVGKANTPEFATEGFTANRLFGVTRNPWGPRWSPGGSSGGSGAAIAAGMVPIATATDTGGSIRIPAAFCGLAGLKPTKGLVDPDPTLPWADLTSPGPMAPTVDDVRLLLEVESRRPPLGDPGPPRRVVAVPRFHPWGPLPRPVAEAFDRALDAVDGELALPVERVEPERLIRPGSLDTDWAVWAAPELVEWLGRDRAEASLEVLSPTTRSFVEFGLRVPEADHRAARERGKRYSQELEGTLGGDAVIASPTLAAEGWLAEGPLPGSGQPAPPPEVYNTEVPNLTGLPAITVPAGRLQNGLPFGLQLIGPRWGDAMLLHVAEAWERARPWPPTAEGYEPFAT